MPMSRAEGVRVVADVKELARAAAEIVLASASDSIGARGYFHIALAGGSTPRRAYAELARGDAARFERWHAWFGDERCVPPEDDHSNYRMAAESGLLALVPVAQVHRL